MRLLRVLAVVAAIVAVIFFILAGSSTSTPSDIDWGLVALAASVGFLALDPMVGPVR